MEKTNGCKMLGMMGDEGFEKIRRVYSTEALVPAISTKEDRIKICVGGVQEHQTPTQNAAMGMGGGQTSVVFEKCIVAMRGRNPESPTCGSPTMRNGKKIIEENQSVETQYRIRKLTPKECWRLMGYTDADYEKAAAVNSDTQLYKQAGNAIVKQVLIAIFRQMIPESARKKV